MSVVEIEKALHHLSEQDRVEVLRYMCSEWEDMMDGFLSEQALAKNDFVSLGEVENKIHAKFGKA